MIRNLKYCLAIMICMICIRAYPQTSHVMYYMKIPQNHLLNPATQPANRFYIGLPVLTGVSAGFGNNFLSLTDLLPPGSRIDSTWADKPGFDLGKLTGKLKEHNTISLDMGIQLLGIGLTFGKDLYVFMDVIDRISSKTIFPRDLLELYFMSPADYLGRTIDLSGLKIKEQYYREYGLGFSKNLTPALRIGMKAKLLSGISSASLNSNSFTLKVNNDFSQSVTADAYFDISGKETLNKIFYDNNLQLLSGGFIRKADDTKPVNTGGLVRDYLSVPLTNTGAGIDIGAVYNMGKLFSFSASVTDLGYIRWKKDLGGYYSRNSFTLPGISLKDVIDNPDIKIDSMVNSLKTAIKDNFRDTVPPAFTTYLPATINFGASIRLLPVLTLGVVSNTKLYNGILNQALSFSANAYLGRIVSASISYTMANNTYNNLGLGLALKGGPVQFYVVADKIPMTTYKIYVYENGSAGYKPVSLPRNMNLLNLQVGFNIAFGKPVTKKTDKPMVVVESND